MSEGVKVRIGRGVLTRDLVWCECGRGLSLRGIWVFCPTCGRKLDQQSYATAISEAMKNGAEPFVDADTSALLTEVKMLREKVKAGNELRHAIIEIRSLLPWIRWEGFTVQLDRATSLADVAISAYNALKAASPKP